jgi:hypothetical protein
MSSFTKELVKVELSTGETIELPRMTLGKILVVTNAITKLVAAAKQHFPEVFTENTLDRNPAQFGLTIIKSLPEMFPILSEEILTVVGSYLGKDVPWLKENLDLEDISKIAPPFFQAIMAQANHIMGVVNHLPGFSKETSQLSKPEPTSNEVLPS